MKRTANQRFQTGDVCGETGWYEFDGYVNGPPGPLPRLIEWQALVIAGDMFPRIQSPERMCYWKRVDGSPWLVRQSRGKASRLSERRQ